MTDDGLPRRPRTTATNDDHDERRRDDDYDGTTTDYHDDDYDGTATDYHDDDDHDGLPRRRPRRTTVKGKPSLGF
jgi:hypothetical protein